MEHLCFTCNSQTHAVTTPLARTELTHLYSAPGFTMAIAAASDLYAHSTNSADFLSIFPTKKVSFKSPWKPYSGKKKCMKKNVCKNKKKNE